LASNDTPSKDVDLNELVELEVLGEVDEDGNPVEQPEADAEAEADVVDFPETETAGEDAETADPQAALVEERDRLKEDLLRAQADFINFRKRMERDKGEVVRRASQALIEELLPVVDNFELALANDPEQADPAGYREGVRLIHKQMIDLLTRHGLEEINCVGEAFDPNIHEAVAVVNDPDAENNSIKAQLKKGYTLKDRLIRSPMVQVVIHEDSDAGEAGAGEDKAVDDPEAAETAAD